MSTELRVENCSLAKITRLLIITKIDAGTELMKKRMRNKRKEGGSKRNYNIYNNNLS